MDISLINFKEKSWLAKLAAWVLKKENMAIVMGNCIHLWNADKHYFLSDKQWLRAWRGSQARAEFLDNTRWVKHEMCHIKQFQKEGTIIFITKYLWESIKNGYTNNRFEKEARAAEEL